MTFLPAEYNQSPLLSSYSNAPTARLPNGYRLGRAFVTNMDLEIRQSTFELFVAPVGTCGSPKSLLLAFGPVSQARDSCQSTS